SPKWGAGPYRPSQVDTRAQARWAGYDLSPGDTNRLMTALRDNVGPGIQNSRLRLRTPNEAEFAAALDEQLVPLLKGTKAAELALAEAERRWGAIAAALPPAEWRAMYRRSLGLDLT
ncbi:MAG TPA: hypothetical protein VM597_01225, partial [Gemmataceae bacterium]|nr:hypothetical protein [Gemmataceae bacterium]